MRLLLLRVLCVRLMLNAHDEGVLFTARVIDHRDLDAAELIYCSEAFVLAVALLLETARRLHDSWAADGV
ncbi:hypothetical protein [Roseovarius salis]|uniref:hypothetical protein n=1 Tax=Roseovarius salis TaxID=3376063 RepID=UPI0037C51EA6